jgi:hypothetical protein
MAIEPIVMRPDRPVAAWQLRAWELLAPRLPRWAVRLTGRIMLRLPRGSRARRWCVLSASQIAWDATGRNRYDLVVVRLNPLIVYLHNFRDDADALRTASFAEGTPEALRTHPRAPVFGQIRGRRRD